MLHKLPLRYEFQQDGIVHAIDLKLNANSKIGGYDIVLQTYHFSVDQIKSLDLRQDLRNCMGCPFSFSRKDSPLSGKCYTHKGMQRQGLNSKLNRLSKLENIPAYSPELFKAFFDQVKKTKLKLVRFGAYGEPVNLPLEVRDALWGLVDNKKVKGTGYTHAWRTTKDTRFMASVHTLGEFIDATALGYRCYMVTDEAEADETMINCPASKEAGRKVTCTECGLCCGSKMPNAKSIFILNH